MNVTSLAVFEIYVALTGFRSIARTGLGIPNTDWRPSLAVKHVNARLPNVDFACCLRFGSACHTRGDILSSFSRQADGPTDSNG